LLDTARTCRRQPLIPLNDTVYRRRAPEPSSRFQQRRNTWAPPGGVNYLWNTHTFPPGLESSPMKSQPESNSLKSDPLGSLKFRPIDPPNTNILLYKPGSQIDTQISSPQCPGSPKVIILATWLGGASASRIAVYCRGYQAAYPTASILLLRTVLSDITVKSSAVVQAQLKPAHDFLLSAFPPNRSHTHDKATLPFRSKMLSVIGLQYVASLMVRSTPEMRRYECHVCDMVIAAGCPQ
jgi:hypothetical protein